MDFTVEKFANFGTNEDWVARLMMGMPEIIDHIPVSESKKKQIKDISFDIYTELGYAFESLNKIDTESSVLSLEKEYQNLYSSLWRAYKDRLQNMTQEIGYDIGFLFKKDDAFERESQLFFEQNKELPKEFRKILKIDRKLWQNGLNLTFQNCKLIQLKLCSKITGIIKFQVIRLKMN